MMKTLFSACPKNNIAMFIQNTWLFIQFCLKNKWRDVVLIFISEGFDEL